MARGKLFEALFGKSRKSKSAQRDALKRSGTAHSRRLCLESLEQRQLLSTNIGITKDDGNTTVIPGDTLFYDLTIDVSAMTGTATNVTITETLPNGCTLNASTSSYWVRQGTSNIYIYDDQGTLDSVDPANGDLMLPPFGVDIDDPTTVTQIVNTVVLTSDQGDHVTATDTDQVQQLTTNPLIIGKDDGVTQASAGQTIVYTITYATTADVTGVVLEETVPANTTYSSVNTALGWTETSSGSGIYHLNVGAMSAGSELTTTFTVTVAASPSGSTIDNTATITDSAAHSRSATDSDTILAPSSLSVTKSDGVSSASPGDTLTYTIGYSNTGASSVSGVTLAETLPTGLNFNSASNAGWSLSGSTLTRSVGTLAGGASGSATLVLTVANPAPADLATIVNTVTISGGSNTATASDADTLVAAPVFSISKDDGKTAAAPGDVLSYVINYANTGDQNAAGVIITETLPVGTTFNSGASTAGWTASGSGVYVYTVGALAGMAGSGTVTFAVTVNSAQAAGQASIVNAGAMISDGTVSATSTADTDTLNAAPDLAVTKTDNLTQVGAGQTLAYTIGYSNVGTQGATGVVLTDTLPANLTFSSANNTGWTQSGSTLTYAVGTVAAGASGSATLNLTVDSAAAVGDTVTNAVAIADDGANGADTDPTNNTASDTDTVSGVDLSIAKIVSTSSAIAGQAITYTITVKNVGAGAAPSVVVTDALPAATTLVSATAPSGYTVTGPDVGFTGTVTFSGGSLAAGASVTLTLVVQTSPDLANGKTFSNSATVASSVNDLNTANNAATSGSTIVRMAGVGVYTSSVDPTKTDLIIGGSASTDVILVTATSSGRITVYKNGSSFGPYTITGRIVAYGRGGADSIYVSSTCSLPAMLFGGAGNDVLYAGKGKTVLVGGDGNDTLVAGRGYNILIGGAGADTLNGALGNNILIGGSTVYDAHEIGLNALLSEWSRDLPYWKRVRHIFDGGAGILPARLNGPYYFNTRTLRDDAARDIVLGGSGADFFFSHSSGGGTYDYLVGLQDGVEWLRYY